jgi:hypothetical protein
MSTKKKSDIGHYARIPLHIARANVSETAKAMWRELAFLSSPESPVVWVRQSDFAKKLKCCTKTIQRALKELVEAELLSFAGWMHGRYKKYKMAWKKIFAGEGQNCPTTSDMNVHVPETPVAEVPGQFCPPIIREAEQVKEHFFLSSPTPEQQAEELIAEHEQEYLQRFPCLDGRAARPSLKKCIEHALNHSARLKYRSLKVYIDMWLTNAAQKWHPQYVKDAGVYIQSPEERQRARDWEKVAHDRCEAEAAVFYAEERRKRDEKREAEILAHCMG